MADEAPGRVVEDSERPGVDRILAERGVTLKRDDGCTVPAGCAGEGQLIRVKSFPGVLSAVCFRGAGDGGRPAPERSSVSTVTGDGRATRVDMTAGGEQRTRGVGDTGTWTRVGRGPDGRRRDWALVGIGTSGWRSRRRGLGAR